MGLLLKLALITSLFILTIFFAPFLPPHNIRFTAYTLQPPLPLEGKLAPNSILDKAEEILVDREFQGPESIAVRNGNEIFTGLVGGELVRINIKDGSSKTITRIGKQCDGPWDHKNCGRIAGVRFGSDGKLYVADAAYGIFKIDVDAGNVETLISNFDTKIEGKLPKFPDDLDISKNLEFIYWSDASSVADIPNIFNEFLGSPTGRLIKTEVKTKKSTVLVSDLHFANGVQLSESEDFVLVTETARARVIRHWLKGEKKGKTDVFVDFLPGLPDNVRPNGKGGFYIVLSTPRIPSEVSLIDLVGPLPLVRRFISRTTHFMVASLEFIGLFFHGPLIREWIAYAQHLGPLGDMENFPYKTIIVETDGSGNIIGSLQNEKGPVKCLSEIKVEKDWTYIGSPSQRKLFRIKTEYLR